MAFATIGTTGIANDAVTSAKVAPGVVDTEAQPNQAPIIINGDMAVAQRGTSTGITTPGYYACDRFQTAIGNLATWTISQDSDVPSGYGFANSLKLDCTTADASPSTGEVLIVRQRFEGQDVQLLKKGTSSAEKVTVAFWIKATKTGTNILELFDRDNSRTISQSYTISSSNTWEYKVINFSADTTGTLDDDNNLSFEIAWWLGSGTDYTSGTLQTSWGSQTDADRAVGQVNHGDSTSNNVFITGVQMEVGEFTSSTIPPFKHESFGDNLRRCQRYYYKLKNDSGSATGAYWGSGLIDSSTTLKSPIRFPTMRTVPSAFETTGTASDYRVWTSGNTSTVCSSIPTLDQITSFSGRLLFTVSSGLTAGQVGAYRSSTTDAYLAWSAEL